MAQVGSCWTIPSNVRRAIRNQYECSIATPRSNSARALGSHEVGNVTLPSFWSCWPIAPPASTAVIRPAAKKVRRNCVFIASLPMDNGLWLTDLSQQAAGEHKSVHFGRLEPPVAFKSKFGMAERKVRL